MTLLKDLGVTLNLKKCHFFTYPYDYFVHLLCYGRLRVWTVATDRIQIVHKPTTVMKLRFFWCLCKKFRFGDLDFAGGAVLLYEKLQRFSGRVLTDYPTTKQLPWRC